MNRQLKILSWWSKRATRILLVVCFIQSTYTNWAVLHEREINRKAIVTAVCTLIAAVPPNTLERIDIQRKKLNCGDYIPTIHP